MSVPVISLWMACLLWCAGLACVDDRPSLAVSGEAVFGKARSASRVLPAVSVSEPVKCEAKHRSIEPMWPHAAADGNDVVRFTGNTSAGFLRCPEAPDLEQVPWVGVIELRV